MIRGTDGISIPEEHGVNRTILVTSEMQATLTGL